MWIRTHRYQPTVSVILTSASASELTSRHLVCGSLLSQGIIIGHISSSEVMTADEVAPDHRNPRWASE